MSSNKVAADKDTETMEPLTNGQATEEKPSPNIVLLGAMGSGKTAVGWILARLIGYGFLDLDEYIEKREGSSIAEIFSAKGEAYFRTLEKQSVERLSGLKRHVLAVGGGAVIDDDNWNILKSLGATVWLSTPPEEIARRLSVAGNELEKRPLLADVASQEDRMVRQKLLTERLGALIGGRRQRYQEAQVVVSDSFSTPQSTAGHIKKILVSNGFLALAEDQRPYDRWRIL